MSNLLERYGSVTLYRKTFKVCNILASTTYVSGIYYRILPGELIVHFLKLLCFLFRSTGSVV